MFLLGYGDLKRDHEEKERHEEQVRGQEKSPFALDMIDGDGDVCSRELLRAMGVAWTAQG